MDWNKVIQFKPVSRLKPNLRKFEAIEAAKSVPLFHSIIAPTEDKFYVQKNNVAAMKFAEKVSSKFNAFSSGD